MAIITGMKMRFAVLMRSVHLYVSMTASVCIAFFALTGLVANLADDDARDPIHTVPEAALTSPETLAGHLQTELSLPAPPQLEDIGGTMYVATVDLGDATLDITVYRATAALETRRWSRLPPDLALDRASLKTWLSGRFDGTVTTSDDADDPEATQIDLRVESVWRTDTVTVDREDRRWGVSTTRHGLAAALTDLHTGRFASWWQHLLMDAVAIVLLLSVLTGTLLGITWAMRTQRRILFIGIILGASLCLFALIAGR